jgi:hypothetical protein
MNTKDYPISRQNNIVTQEVESELLIYDLVDNKAFCLNETSAFVWQNCDGNSSVDSIAERMSRKLKTNVSEDLIWLTLKELKKLNLLESKDFDNKYEGLTRREVVKKVGFASMVALPIIASVIAPTALHAQSGGSVNCNQQIFCGCTAPPAQNALDQGCDCMFNSDCCGVCSGVADPNGNPVLNPDGTPVMICSAPTPLAQMDAAACCCPFP